MKDKRRWIEWGKDVLIVLLSLSAVYLLTMTPLVQDSGVLTLLAPPESPKAGVSGESRGIAMLPVRLAITGEGGRRGVQYNEALLEELFPPLGALLGDALASAGDPQPISEAQWRTYLGDDSIYFDFAGEVPLSALERWLQGSRKAGLTGTARRVLLCAGEGDQVLLCWQEPEAGQFFSCATALTQSLHLTPALAGSPSNGAYFAFENSALAGRLAPYTLITEGRHQGPDYAVTLPLAGQDEVEAVLTALAFSSLNSGTVSGGQVYLDGGDRLVVNDGGAVTYRAAQGEKYPVTNWSKADPGNGVDEARALAESTLGTLCGAARLYLMSAQDTGNGLCIRFGYLLDGCAVYLGSEGWAAEFWVQDGYITQFTLQFRSYAANGESSLLLPIDMAAAMLDAAGQGRSELAIQYRDSGGQAVSPQWVAG